MHVIQYIAVQAEDTDMAFRTVKNHLEAELGGQYDNSNAWFDWFVTGGGRWATDPEANQYNDEWQGDVVHQDDPRFQEYLDTAQKYRMQELGQYEKQARKINLTDLLDKLEGFEHDHFDVGMELYSIKKIYDLAMGVWDFNSYYLDIHHDSTHMKHMLDSIDNGAKSWYLVPVDFHF